LSTDFTSPKQFVSGPAGGDVVLGLGEVLGDVLGDGLVVVGLGAGEVVVGLGGGVVVLGLGAGDVAVALGEDDGLVVAVGLGSVPQ